MKAFRTWSEISYGLSETTHGSNPQGRRVYKSRLKKVRRQMDKAVIAAALEDQSHREVDIEWDEYWDEYLSSLSSKSLEVEEMWHNWKLEQCSQTFEEAEADKALQIQVAWFWHTHL